MKKGIMTVMAICLAAGLTLAGCGAGKAGSSQEAIANTKTMDTAQAKADYLIGQAKAFYASEDFQNAVNAAQYVLQYLDKDSQAAKSLLEKAKTDLAAQAKKAAADLQKSFGK
jgi:uncharacterized protein YpiB (UPF0302 family)